MNKDKSPTDILEQTMKNITEIKSFKLLLKLIFDFTIFYKKQIRYAFCMSLMCFGFISYKIGFAEDTINIVIDIINDTYDISINIFGIILTAYGLFQALSSESFIKRLMESSSENTDNRSLFEDYNIFFIKTSMYYFFMVVLSYILKNIFRGIDSKWHIKIFPNNINNIIATVFIFIYLFLNIYGFFLVKSVLYNIYQAFNMKGYQICDDE